jgi:hypothetical protein
MDSEMIGDLLSWRSEGDPSYRTVYVIISSSPEDPQGRLYRLSPKGDILTNWESNWKSRMHQNVLTSNNWAVTWTQS